MNDFASPAQTGSAFDYNEALGHLLVVTVHSYEEAIPTSLGDKPAVRADILDVDNPTLSAQDVLIFPKVLVGSLRPRVGQRVLGRLGKGVAKPGQSAPWLLIDAVDNAADVKAAQKALAGAQKVTRPAPAVGGRTVPADIPF